MEIVQDKIRIRTLTNDDFPLMLKCEFSKYISQRTVWKEKAPCPNIILRD